VDLATRAVEDGWDWRILNTDRLAKALGLTDPTGGSGTNTNSVLSVGHSITPVPEPGTVFVLGAAAIAGIMVTRRRRAR
jgi:hypothetical protein